MWPDYNPMPVVKSISRSIAQINETMYQIGHRKVKDRYASSKFYMNNFKRNRKRK